MPDNIEIEKVKFGPRESEAINDLKNSFNIPSLNITIRMCVTVASALHNAIRLGLKVELIGTNGKRYSYSLYEPKVASEISPDGIKTGSKINLIDFDAKNPLDNKPKSKAKLKIVK